MIEFYGHDFYKDTHDATVYAARTVLPVVLGALPAVHSAVDFGCGVGTWLAVLKENGVEEILGLDGAWVEKDLLKIPVGDFREAFFDGPIALGKRYDLAMSLEVAEHLPPENAPHFVDSLVSASDFVLFSAAIPGQGGTNHLNEQWPEYWVGMFRERGYKALDLVRGGIWRDQRIYPWYRQNILMFADNERLHEVNIRNGIGLNNYDPLSLVHPELFVGKSQELAAMAKRELSIKESWAMLKTSIRNRVKRQFRQ